MALVVYLPASWAFLHQPNPIFPNHEQWLWSLRAALAGLSVAGLLAMGTVLRVPQSRRDRFGLLSAFPAASEPAASNAVLRVAFSEAIGFYGLLLFIGGGHLGDLFAFCGASLAALAWYFPTRARWERELAAGRSGA
jgi:hypothetical protein